MCLCVLWGVLQWEWGGGASDLGADCARLQQSEQFEPRHQQRRRQLRLRVVPHRPTTATPAAAAGTHCTTTTLLHLR